ncbi:unnamed protein product [Pleuronectes platessa]|uniref:Uncharacterized protein n=1 Tax=Pleuronectes platessa TaxID=8262 RepID=A0A9N7Z0B0_PLEPL|nr:unnamed protein product [Pleuronectes platessa]
MTHLVYTGGHTEQWAAMHGAPGSRYVVFLLSLRGFEPETTVGFSAHSPTFCHQSPEAIVGVPFRRIVSLKFPRVSLEFYIDVHAHSTMLNGFMYGNVFEDEERVQRQAVFPRLLCQNAPDFSFLAQGSSPSLCIAPPPAHSALPKAQQQPAAAAQHNQGKLPLVAAKSAFQRRQLSLQQSGVTSNTSFNRDVVKAGTGRRFLGGLLDDTSYCYTLEVSFYSYMPAGSNAPVPYTEETYMKLGRNVARTFLDYYKLSNLIKDNRPSHIQSSEVKSPTGNGKDNGVGRDAVDRQREKSQGDRH